MVNTKQTLKNLHKKFPMMSLDELFEVLDCYVEESLFTPIDTKPSWTPLTTSPGKIWYDNHITSIHSGDEQPLIAKNNYRYSLAGDAQSESL